MSEQQSNEPRFEIQKIYIKDVSLESPNAPLIFTEQWKPDVTLQINNSTSRVSDEGLYEVNLSVTVTAKQGDKTAYLVEVTQSGVFTIANFPDEQLGGMLGAYCPNLLFPFARQAVAQLIQDAGFPQLMLAPVNFDALYMQHLQSRQTPQAANGMA